MHDKEIIRMSIEKIDTALCNGCKICVDSCPMDVIRMDTLVESKVEFPACRIACPANVDIRSYAYMVREDMLEEAIGVLRESLPFPAVTGRVCPHPCESECARKEVDEATNINSMERFVGDYWLKEQAQPVRQIYAAKTAIIGSGPAGLACAYFLIKMGYPVTVFESMPVLGGMLRLGIPEFRLPKAVLEAQINFIKDMGVEFKTGITVGKDITLDEIKKQYSAVFLAIGKSLNSNIKLEGCETEGVSWGLDFLREINLKGTVAVKKRVVVIGGGNVAVDVALSAKRLGAEKVYIACLEAKNAMPAFEEELKQATEAGIEIIPSWGPQRIVTEGGIVKGIELVRCLKLTDERGKFNPTFDNAEGKTIDADMIIFAVGQKLDISMLPQDVKLTVENTVKVNMVTLETSISGIFAGGDAALNGSTVVDAIASGKRAAISIDLYHKGKDLTQGRYHQPDRVRRSPKEGIEKLSRQPTPMLPVDQRTGNFKEVKQGFNSDSIHLEAQRCMTCGSRAVITYPDDCQLCLFCERDCPQKAIYVSPDKKATPLMSWG
jgi:NADPH-dependent glutamate synthase beta subunit-like oxidoreductase